MAGTIRKRTWVTGKGESKTAWTANYPDRDGKWHLKTFAAKRAAAAWLDQAKIEVRDGMHTPDSASATVADAAGLWLKRGAANGLERGSLRTYEQYVRLGIVPMLGRTRLSRLTRPMVETFRDALLERFAWGRARLILSALRMVLGHAQGRGLVAQNVARDVRIDDRPRTGEQLECGRSIPSREEAARLFDNAERWFRVMILLAAATGMRSGELRGLEWSAVDLKAERIIVRQRADQWGAIGKPKTKAGQRALDLVPAVAAELRRWWGSPGRHPVWVFPGRAGDKPIGQATVTKKIAELQAALGIVRPAAGTNRQGGKGSRGTAPIPKYTLHELRHYFASALIELGCNSKRLQAAMGHNRITTTFDIYGHLFPEPGDRTERLAALERFVLNKPAS